MATPAAGFLALNRRPESQMHLSRMTSASGLRNIPKSGTRAAIPDKNDVEKNNGVDEADGKMVAGVMGKKETDASGESEDIDEYANIAPFVDQMKFGLTDAMRDELHGLGSEKPWYIIDASKNFYWGWWCLIAFASMLTGVTTPLAMSFVEDPSNYETPLDCIFILDIILTFFVSIEKHGIKVYDHKIICLKYIKGNLIWDIIAVLPLEAAGGNWKYSGFLRLLRLIRLRRFFPLLTVMEKSYFFNYTIVSFFKYVMMATFNAHWSACIFYELAEVQNFNETTWVFNNAPGLENEPDPTKYATSLYWAVTTLTTVGYGDIAPQNNGERAWVIIYMMTNLGLTSYLIGNITLLVSRPDSVTAEFRSRLDEISKYMKMMETPDALHNQVIHFVQIQHAMKLRQGNEMLNKLPAAIRTPLMKHRFLSLLSKVDIFQGVSHQFSERILDGITEEMFMQGMIVLNQGDYGGSFYVVSKGVVEILAPCESGKFEGEYVPVALIKAGGHFGGEGFFASGLQPYTVRVKKHLVVLRIHEGFKNELALHMAQDMHIVLTNVIKRLDCLLLDSHLGSRSRAARTLTPSQRRILSATSSIDTKRNPMSRLGSTGGTGAGEDQSKTIVNSMDTSCSIPHFYPPSNNKIAPLELKEVNSTSPNIKSRVSDTRSHAVSPSMRKMYSAPTLRKSGVNPSPPSSKMDDSKKGEKGGDKIPKCDKASMFQEPESDISSPIKYVNFIAQSKPFRECILETIKEVKSFRERHEHEMASQLCQLANSGDHKLLLKKLHGINLERDPGDYDKRVPLHLACARGNFDVVKVLHQHRADLSHEDHAGRTPLMEAVESGNDTIIRYLVDHKAKLRLRKPAQYLCDLAAHGSLSALKRLCIAKVDVNAADYDKRTALHLAAAEGKEKTCRMLVEFKANIMFKDRWGETPLESVPTMWHCPSFLSCKSTVQISIYNPLLT